MISDEDWCVEVSLVYREANVCADRLAKHGHSLELGVSIFDKIPSFICQEVFVGSSVVVRPRMIHL